MYITINQLQNNSDTPIAVAKNDDESGNPEEHGQNLDYTDSVTAPGGKQSVPTGGWKVGDIDNPRFLQFQVAGLDRPSYTKLYVTASDPSADYLNLLATYGREGHPGSEPILLLGDVPAGQEISLGLTRRATQEDGGIVVVGTLDIDEEVK